MKKVLISLLLAFASVAFLLTVLTPKTPGAQASNAHPLPNAARGLVYAGLVGAPDQCPSGFRVQLRGVASSQVICTHGPDAPPPGFDVRRTVAPVRAALSTGLPSGVVCDGDGVTGMRVQVIYAHEAGTPDNYNTYLTSIQQWAAEADSDFNTSAQQTSGTRHIRYVTDGDCNPVVADVTLSPTGLDTFGNTVSDLQALGYNLSNRDYMVFGDAHVYCGIGGVEYDDQPGPGNRNNLAPHYGRTDAGCWSGPVAAHEFMHNIGGVQLSAPHSDGSWHCTDGYDNMCDHSGLPLPTPYPCQDPAMDSLFDCGHDDYFNTNPQAGTYLANYWNAANSVFLIGGGSSPKPTPTLNPTPVPTATPTASATKTARINSNVSGVLKSGVFTPANNFRRGTGVTLQLHVVDQNGVSIANTSIALAFDNPLGGAQCSVVTITNSTGTAYANCQIPKKALTGSWNGHVNSFSVVGYTSDVVDSVMNDSFTVQ